MGERIDEHRVDHDVADLGYVLAAESVWPGALENITVGAADHGDFGREEGDADPQHEQADHHQHRERRRQDQGVAVQPLAQEQDLQAGAHDHEQSEEVVAGLKPDRADVDDRGAVQERKARQRHEHDPPGHEQQRERQGDQQHAGDGHAEALVARTLKRPGMRVRRLGIRARPGFRSPMVHLASAMESIPDHASSQPAPAAAQASRAGASEQPVGGQRVVEIDDLQPGRRCHRQGLGPNHHRSRFQRLLEVGHQQGWKLGKMLTHEPQVFTHELGAMDILIEDRQGVTPIEKAPREMNQGGFHARRRCPP